MKRRRFDGPLALVPVLLFAVAVAMPPINHDVAAILSFSERWLAGETLYVDLIDVNPPMIFVLNLLPAALARWLGVSAVSALQGCLVLLVLGAWMLTLRVRDRAAEPPVTRTVLDVLPGLVGFGSGYDFGQRETMMALLAMPYLLSATRRADGMRPRAQVAAAALAALGFALKPHFLVIPALVEFLVLARGLGRRGRRAVFDRVPWVMAGLWAGYLASLPLLFPHYVGSVVPLVIDLYLDNGGQTPWSLLLLPRMGTVVFLLVPLAVIAWRQGATLPRVLALAAMGALASALLQHKGWSYHIMPIELFALSLGVVLGAGALDRLAVRPAGGAALLAWLFALYLVAEGEAPWNQITWTTSDAFVLSEVLRAEAGGERVLVLSPGIAPAFPALNYAQARMTLRTMNTWLLEGAYRTCPESGARYREPWEMARPEFFMFRTVAEDFARNPPAAVVVDSFSAIPECNGQAFDLIAYFSRHPLFAEMWRHYAPAARQGRFQVFTRRD